MSRIGPLLCPILVGRDDLLDLAERRIAEAAAGRGQFVLLAGDAGIGKTRLIEAIERKAAASAFTVVGGYLAPHDRYVPAELILDLARSLRRMPEFAGLGDELLAPWAAARGDELTSRRLYVLDVVDRLVAAFDRPTLLVFEDLQWADEVSLEIVNELARQTRDRAVLIVGAYRTDDVPSGAVLREWRARLLGQRLAEEARIAPLTQDETALMTTLILATGLPAPRDVISAVYERTDGVPLHIEELLGALGDDARSDGQAIREADVPATIEDAILARLNRLSPETRAVAQAGAVIGRCFVPEVLAGIMDRPVADLDGPIRELMEHSYLDGPGVRGLIDFRHQVLRDVLYRSVPASELRKLHARAGEFGAQLEGHSEIHASVHYERAGLRAQAFRSALAGARDASRLSSRSEANELYRRAIANMPDDLPVVEQADLYKAYSDAAASVDDGEHSEEAARLAREGYLAAGRLVEAAGMLDSLASIARREVRPTNEHRELVDRGLAELEPLPPSDGLESVRSDLLMFRALTYLDEMNLAAARASALASRDASTAAGLRYAELDADALVAQLDALEGDVDAGLARMMRVAREAREAGMEDVGVTAYRNTAALAMRLMDYRTAEAALAEGLRYADAVEQSHCRHVMRATAAMLAWAEGRWDEAVSGGRQELADRGCRRGLLGSLDAIGYVAVGRGNVDTAREALQRSLDAGRASGELERTFPALWGLSEADLVAGDPTSAVERSEEALALAESSGERAYFVPFVVTGTRARLALNLPDEAERWLARAVEHLAGWEDFARPAIDQAAGLVRMAGGSSAAARDALEAAVRGWTERGRQWERAWARLDLAQCLMRTNQFGQAASLLAAVRAWAEVVDSPPLLARADELARLGRGRGLSVEPWRPLTAREFEVSRLIAGGMTNAEIADELAIAPKTASAHVEHILAKLGVTRRAEIAAWTATIVAAGASGANGPGMPAGADAAGSRAAANGPDGRGSRMTVRAR